MDSVATNPQVYLHIRVIIGIVLGLCITRLLTGFARLVQHPGRQRVYPVHLGWALSLLLAVAHFWWWEFRFAVASWTFGLYLFIIFYAALFFLLCVLLFPDDLTDYAGYEDYFLSRRKWFFGILALTFVVDVFDTLLKGADYLRGFGYEYELRITGYLLLCGIAIATRNRLFHLVFMVANIVYQLSWILRLYDTLG